MQVTSLISQAEGHSHEHGDNCGCGHDHEHSVVHLWQAVLGVVFVLNAFVVDWLFESGGTVASANNVKAIQADAKAFTDLLPAYEKNKNLFAQQRVAETMALVLTNVQDKFFLPQRADGQARELRLQLNREPPEPKSATTAH